MTKIKSFLVVFIPAYVLSRVLMGLFNFSGFSFHEPSFLTLIFDLVIWFLSWSVVYILYVTLRHSAIGKLPDVKTETDSHYKGDGQNEVS